MPFFCKIKNTIIYFKKSWQKELIKLTKLLEIKKWKEHNWAKNEMVKEIDVHFLKSIANPVAKDYTNLSITR